MACVICIQTQLELNEMKPKLPIGRPGRQPTGHASFENQNPISQGSHRDENHSAEREKKQGKQKVTVRFCVG